MTLRVLMTSDTVGGVWDYSLDLARALAAHGVEVRLATMGRRPSADQQARAAACPGLHLHESAFRLEWMDEPWDDVARAGEWLRKLERELAPDVVHLNGYAHATVDFRAPTVVVAHSCVMTWWEAVYGGAPPSRFDRYRGEVRAGIEAASALVAPTRSMLEALRRCYGLGEVGRVIYNGIWLDGLGSTPKEAFVLAAGRLWDPAKNVAALACCADELPWPVHVAGEEGAQQRLPSGIQVLGVLPRTDLWQAMSEAAIFAHPARYEPFGLAPVEAAACGCALVLGDVPTLREVWADAAVFVPPNDRDALERAIGALIEQPRWRRMMANAAYDRARRYDITRTAVDYLHLYETLEPERIAVPPTERPERSQPLESRCDSSSSANRS